MYLLGFIAGRIAMAALARLCINISFACIYLWIVEIFPTFLRYVLAVLFMDCNTNTMPRRSLADKLDFQQREDGDELYS